MQKILLSIVIHNAQLVLIRWASCLTMIIKDGVDRVLPSSTCKVDNFALHRYYLLMNTCRLPACCNNQQSMTGSGCVHKNWNIYLDNMYILYLKFVIDPLFKMWFLEARRLSQLYLSALELRSQPLFEITLFLLQLYLYYLK